MFNQPTPGLYSQQITVETTYLLASHCYSASKAPLNLLASVNASVHDFTILIKDRIDY